MSRDLSRVAADIGDSERAAEAWPEALKAMTEALGAAGAACIVANKNSNSADWVCFSGLSERFKSDYVDHFAPLDPFLPHLNVAPRWIKLSDCLPQSLLRQSEWYNDFGRCHVVCGLVAEGHDENQLFRISIPSRDHSPGDLALSQVHPQLSRRRGLARGARNCNFVRGSPTLGESFRTDHCR